MEIDLAIKKNKILSFSGKGMELEIIIFNKISQMQKDKYHVFSHMWKQKSKRTAYRMENLLVVYLEYIRSSKIKHVNTPEIM